MPSMTSFASPMRSVASFVEEARDEDLDLERARCSRRTSTIIAGTGAVTCMPRSATLLSASNGRWPVSISYRIDAERVEVGARVDRLPERLLRRHVLGRPVDHAGLREDVLLRAGAVVRAELAHLDLGDAEVEDLHEVRVAVALDEHDVLGLEIAMHDLERVRALERAGDLPRDVERAAELEPPARDDLAQARALDELEHEEERAVLELAEVGGGDDVRVVDVRRRHRLALEARDDLGQARHLRDGAP